MINEKKLNKQNSKFLSYLGKSGQRPVCEGYLEEQNVKSGSG